MAMGSPLSPVLAEIVTESLIHSVLGSVTVIVPVIRKYVDDLFLCVPEYAVNDVLRTFNNYHPSLQFTVEIEQLGTLPFLDMLVIRNDDQTFSTDWYMKPIASGRFLNYHSMHPLHLKTNIAWNLIKRINNLTTSRTADEKKQTIYTQLKLNDYPKRLINRLINTNSQMTTQQPPPDTTEHMTYKSIPYIQKLTPKITKSIQRSGEYQNIKICHYNVNTIERIYRTMKGTTEMGERSNVIYGLRCSQCTAKYVGLTTNKLRTRLYGHKSDKNKLEKTLKIEDPEDRAIQLEQLKYRTAIMEHSIKTGHKFDYENPKILDSSNKPSRLPILEISHIMTTQNINKRSDTEGLSISYAGIMHTIKTQNDTHNHNSYRQPISLTHQSTTQP